MRIHHLNCGTMCPHSARLINGEGGLLEAGRIVCHCLLIEAGDGLLLVDTGFGTGDARKPRQLGPLFSIMGAKVELGETALKQVEALGFSAGDVRHIVATHLDPDHSGGLPDFPEAEVHVFAPELEVALEPGLRDRQRYLAPHFRHGPRWVKHDVEGDEWHGFESVRILSDLDAEVLLVPLVGHSRGHTGVAVDTADGWLLHCGDAYFHQGEIATPPHCPPGLRAFQRLMADDNSLRVANRERLRELAIRHGEEVRLLCSHDPFELDRAQAAGAAAAA
jgi:glyoxylase-like metal-dependent hydrolase (beta-lactamase superfamily II)